MGTVLGVMEGVDWGQMTVLMGQGDKLVLDPDMRDPGPERPGRIF